MIPFSAGESCHFSPILAIRYNNSLNWGAPSLAYLSFTMKLARSVLDEEVLETAAAEVLDVVESFLVRRAIAGYEPTGLHAVFKRLWGDLGGDVSALSVSRAIAAHKTVTWPDAAEIMKSIATRPLYGSAITAYLLIEYDASHGGDSHNSIETIEHVLPQTARECQNGNSYMGRTM